MSTIDVVEKALDLRARYHKVLAGNIANVETPNYKEKDIDFQKEMGRNVGGGLTSVEIKESTDGDVIGSIDGNTVNMENQIVKLTENSMFFTSLVQVIGKKLSMMKYAISEGKR
ncbi:MAG: Flagellar basal body rod protein FlgB [Syntrophorhabdus sp. PtaU1.Bin153]|nr:MAG: Flagellar basal body rod protein FlgB [Syntrophorhabdus sp. PtaU1.Bin153]